MIKFLEPLDTMYVVTCMPHPTMTSILPYSHAMWLWNGTSSSHYEIWKPGNIVTSKRMNRFGDKQCAHRDANGTVTFQPDQLTITNGIARFSGTTVLGTTFSKTYGNADNHYYLGGNLPPCNNGNPCSVSHTLSSIGQRTATVHLENDYGAYAGSVQLNNFYEASGSYLYTGTLTCVKNRSDYPYWAVQYYFCSIYVDTIGGVQKDSSGHYKPVKPIWSISDTKITLAKSKIELAMAECLLLGEVFPTQAANSAYEGLRDIGMNSVQYTSDVFRIKEAIMPLLRICRTPFNAKNWANVWLTYRYGIRLFLQDSNELYKRMKAGSKRTPSTFISRGRHSSNVTISSLTYHILDSCKIYAEGISREELTLQKKLALLNFIPSLTNLWDAIPYSFVVDWVLPIGSALESFDRLSYKSTFGVISDVESRKVTVSVPSPSSQVVFDVDVKYYFRSVDVAFSITSLFTALDLGSGLSLRHLFDGMALIRQRH